MVETQEEARRSTLVTFGERVHEMQCHSLAIFLGEGGGAVSTETTQKCVSRVSVE